MKVIVLTQNRDAQYAVEAFRHHASGYLLKDSTGSELVTAIHDALEGRCYISPSLAERLLSEALQMENPDRTRDLTPREREVLQLLAEGKAMKEVETTHLATVMRRRSLRRRDASFSALARPIELADGLRLHQGHGHFASVPTRAPHDRAR